jgi:uncharacterized protein YndB with AHSA1/START domain
MPANDPLIAQVTIAIHAPRLKVWEALTKPELITQYLFGTNVKTTWQVGSPIIYEGLWQGKSYQDKGVVMHFEPGKLLVTTYWSSMAGLADIPENYKTVRCDLTSEEIGTRLTLTQSNNASSEETIHTKDNWKMVLDGIKKLCEGAMQ